MKIVNLLSLDPIRSIVVNHCCKVILTEYVFSVLLPFPCALAKVVFLSLYFYYCCYYFRNKRITSVIIDRHSRFFKSFYINMYTKQMYITSV